MSVSPASLMSVSPEYRLELMSVSPASLMSVSPEYRHRHYLRT
jgi:hypothetical protein